MNTFKRYTYLFAGIVLIALSSCTSTTITTQPREETRLISNDTVTTLTLTTNRVSIPLCNAWQLPTAKQ